MSGIRIDQELDARGLHCPLPLLKAKQAIAGLPANGVLKVVATDPGSVRDFRAWCEQAGHGLLSSSEDKGVFMYLLRKKS